MADWQTQARRTAQQVGIDPNLFVALVRAESTGNPNARSPRGAIGYTQLMPDTARSLGVNPNIPAQNLLGGARYLKQQLKTFHGNVSYALAAYNAGPGAVQKYGGIPPFGETQAYVKSILGSLHGASHAGHVTSGTPAQASAPAATPTFTPSGGFSFDPGQSADATALLGLLGQRQRTTPASTPLPTPAAVAGPAMPAAYRALSAGQGPAPKQDIGSLLAMIQTPGQGVSAPQGSGLAVSPASAPLTASATTSGGQAPKSPHGLPNGVTNFEGTKVAAWIAPALQYARAHGWKGTVNSGFRSYADQQRIYNSGVRPAAKPGTSNHEGSDFPRGAVDVSDAATLSRILAHSPYRKRLIWAGAKDPPHFSFPHNGSY